MSLELVTLFVWELLEENQFLNKEESQETLFFSSLFFLSYLIYKLNARIEMWFSVWAM